jgi:peptidoglycan/xylan/chitin deacetylase (PgdA/CDA1 family)
VFALTFDDGPWQYTEALLDILASRGVSATFFINGIGVAGGTLFDRASTIRRMVREGHCVGSHGWAHVDMTLRTFDGQLANLQQLDEAFRTIIGSRPRYFRPPYGYFSDVTRDVIRRLGYDLALWDIDSKDWELENVEASLQRYDEEMWDDQPWNRGFLSLQHDTIRGTVYELVPRIIDYVRNRGWRFVTVGECVHGERRACWQ